MLMHCARSEFQGSHRVYRLNIRKVTWLLEPMPERHSLTPKHQRLAHLWRGFVGAPQLARAALRLIAPTMVFALSLSALADTSVLSPKASPIELQRQHYLAARDALRRGHLTQYRKYRDRLHGYPLTAYLDFYELNRRLRRLPTEDIDTFLTRYDNSYLGDKLRYRWLQALAEKKRWSEFLQYYQPQMSDSTKLSCQALLARYHTEGDIALDDVAELWNVEQSQPKQCDPVFKLWVDSGRLTPELNWQRFNKSLKAGQRTLARYLAKSLEGRHADLAKLYLEVDRHPQNIRQHNRFQQQDKEMQNIILHGLNRYARKDPLTALHEWTRYDAQQLFEDNQRLATQQQLALQLAKKGHQQAADDLVSQVPQISSDNVTELLIREALKQQDWAKTYRYINHLPPSMQQSERWLYWRARALEVIQTEDPSYPQPQQIYTQLAMQRSFYAFMAADRLGRQYKLGDIPVSPAKEVLQAVASHPSSQRARELLAVNDGLNANREWFHMTNRFEHEAQHIAAAKLAYQWGWHHKTIASMASAKSWDDLRLRFPLAYNKQVFAAAQKQQVSPLLLFAIARQESAFAANAKSPAGAMGLMQLMPTTARYTAKKAGVKYKKSDLLKPGKNIHLGSFYITELLTQFKGNRILAAAAYNAGPHRVKQWLKSSDSKLPNDIWIETIPFRETRKYVQNVLAYSVIYGYRTGTTPAMLSPQEHTETL